MHQPVTPERDEPIDEIREIRHRISARFDHDLSRLVAHYIEFQKQFEHRLIRFAEPASRDIPSDQP